MSRDRGSTLMELLIAMGVSLVILGATYQLYGQARRDYERPRASLELQEELAPLVRRLARELQETSLQSVRSFPNPTAPGEPPGLSFTSPRDEAGALVIGEFGVVRWQSYVYYTLRGASLIRKEGRLSDSWQAPGDTALRIALPSDRMPQGAVEMPGRSRVLSRTVVWEGRADTCGFRVFWDDAGVERPFAQDQVGAPVCVELSLASPPSATGRVSRVRHRLEVDPRN